MHTPKIFTTICLALALSLTGPGVMAKEKKGGGGGKGDRGSSKVVKRDQSRSTARSSGTQRTVLRSNSNRGGGERAVRSKELRRPDRVASSSLASSRQLASRNLDNDRRRDVQRARTATSSSEIRARDTSRSRDLNRAVRDRDGDRDRDRSRYVTRHERHDHDWFVRNNYIYDRDYWHRHHVHRYYNDSLGVFIISPFGPSYAYGSTYVDGYSDYYGFDYETRIAVQQALAELGYYNGPIDGMIGRGTMAAIERYQADNGLAITGGINNSLLRSLNIL